MFATQDHKLTQLYLVATVGCVLSVQHERNNAIGVSPVVEGLKTLSGFICKMERQESTQSQKERKKFAAKIASCIVQVLMFWKLCTKQKKQKK